MRTGVCLIPSLGESAPPVTTKYVVSCRLFVDALYQVDEVLSIPIFLRVFIMNGVKSCHILFLHQLS